MWPRGVGFHESRRDFVAHDEIPRARSVPLRKGVLPQPGLAEAVALALSPGVLECGMQRVGQHPPPLGALLQREDVAVCKEVRGEHSQSDPLPPPPEEPVGGHPGGLHSSDRVDALLVGHVVPERDHRGTALYHPIKCLLVPCWLRRLHQPPVPLPCEVPRRGATFEEGDSNVCAELAVGSRPVAAACEGPIPRFLQLGNAIGFRGVDLN
mmetsp:Transcript_18225/g.58959  ORF Transcript_18225/g.58959 Transcript_18225/m.58959 type:complete len:210 (+) Transcript_18225:510-1139(+)